MGTGSGPGTGAGSGAGPGTGAGPGSTAGPGRGTGTGSGKPAFAGITILGGGSATGAAGRGGSRIGIARPLRTSSYGVTILSTKRTGGGLADYGVFSQEPVYTVYLDMRKAATDRGHSWTLEYAVLREAAPATGGAPPAVRTLQGLVLPFPAVKERPPLPAELVHRHPEKLVVVYGVIDVEGKLGQLAVKDTPDPQINEPLLAALAGWVFRPAELNGARVAVKMLMGIPLCPESIDGPAAP